MNRINNEYDKFINSIAGTNNVDVIPHSTDTADVAAAMVAHARADSKNIADKAAADAKAAADKIVADQAAADKIVADQAAADKVAADQAAADKIVADQAAADKIVADQAAADKVAADQAAADKIVADQAAADKIVADQAAADKVAADQAAADKIVADQAAADKVAANQAAADTALADQAAADKALADQAAADKALADQAAADKALADQAAAKAAEDELIAADQAAAKAAAIQAAAIQAVTETAPTVKASPEHAIAEPSVTAAIIAAAASAATRTIAPVSSTAAAQDTEKAATIDAEDEKSAMSSVIPTVNPESAVCTTQLVAACKAYYVTAQPNVAEITTDASYEDEKQAQSLCGKHALNNLFRSTWSCSNIDEPYTSADLDTIKNENTYNSVENYNKYLKALHTSRPIKLHKLCQLHNVFSGDNQECKEGDAYDMEVLVNALHIAGYNTTHTVIEVNARPTAVDVVLEILNTKPAGLILRTVSDANSGHFIAIRKQTDNDNMYEAIDTLYTNSVDKTNNSSTHAITTTDELKKWLNGAIYKNITNILIVHNFDGKYIPYNPAESSSEDKNMIFTNGDGNVYAYKFGPPRKMIDITEIICNQCKPDAKSQFNINDLYTCIEGFSDAISIDSGVEINNFKGYIPIYENDLNTIIKDIQRKDAPIPEAAEEQPKKDADIQIEAAELHGAVMPAPTQVPLITTVTIDGSQRIANGLLLLISHILKHKNDVQPVGQASTATANDGTESAVTKIVKPSIKFDTSKYNDAVEKFKKNINREFADANSIEISPVTIDIDPEGNDKYILFGSFTAGDVKITRYNTHYDQSIDPKIPGSVKQVPVNIDVVQTPSTASVIAAAPAVTPIVQPPSTSSVIAAAPAVTPIVQPPSTASVNAAAPTATPIVQTPSPTPVIATEPQPNNSAAIAAAANAATNTSTPASQPNNDNYSAAIAAAVAAIAAR